jgi:hypothetical protein
MQFTLYYKDPINDENQEAVKSAIEKINLIVTKNSTTDNQITYTAEGIDTSAASKLFKL